MNTEQLQRAHDLTIRRANIVKAMIRLKHPDAQVLVTDPHARETGYHYEHSAGIDIHKGDKTRLCEAMIVVLDQLVNEVDIALKDLGVE